MNGGEIILADGAHVIAGNEVLHEFLEHVLTADSGVDDLSRDLSLAEAREPHLAGHLAIGAVEVSGHLVGLDLHGHPDDVLVGLLDGRLHFGARLPENPHRYAFRPGPPERRGHEPGGDGISAFVRNESAPSADTQGDE